MLLVDCSGRRAQTWPEDGREAKFSRDIGTPSPGMVKRECSQPGWWEHPGDSADVSFSCFWTETSYFCHDWLRFQYQNLFCSLNAQLLKAGSLLDSGHLWLISAEPHILWKGLSSFHGGCSAELATTNTQQAAAQQTICNCSSQSTKAARAGCFSTSSVGSASPFFQQLESSITTHVRLSSLWKTVPMGLLSGFTRFAWGCEALISLCLLISSTKCSS